MMYILKIFIIAFAFLSNCKSRNLESEVKYALRNETEGKYSFTNGLRLIDESDGKINICIQKMDGANDFKDQKEIAFLFKNVIQKWVDVLQEEENWRVKKIEPQIEIPEIGKQCIEKSRAFTLQYWTSSSEWENDQPKNKNSSAFAKFWESKIILSPGYAHEWKENRQLMLIHEFGHLIGLGDTYSIENKNKPINQPENAFMNNYHKLKNKELQEDDIAGIKALWKSLQPGAKFECGAGYAEGEFEVNEQKYLFCVKETK